MQDLKTHFENNWEELESEFAYSLIENELNYSNPTLEEFKNNLEEFINDSIDSIDKASYYLSTLVFSNKTNSFKNIIDYARQELRSELKRFINI